MIKRLVTILLFLGITLFAFSQAGQGVYQFLELPASSRIAALGGSNVSLRDNDINFAFQNPAALSSDMNNVMGLNIANYLADIRFGSAVYGKSIGKNGRMAFGVQYIDFGLFKGYNEVDVPTSDFTSKDVALSVMYARNLTQHLSVGATLKPIFSAYERYTSYGVAMDAGISYNIPDKLISAGLVFRNIGTQLKGYYTEDGDQHYESIPFNIQLGVTKKLLHAPLRFSATLHNLQRWDLNYQSNNQSSQSLDGTTTDTDKDISFVDMAFRHTIFGVEFVPSPNFYLTLGYNHRRHQEMKIGSFKSSTGFSFGGGIKLYKFQVGFGMSQFQVGNYAYQFSIITSLNDFKM